MLIIVGVAIMLIPIKSQKKDKSVFKTYKKGYYQNSILKDVRAVEESMKVEEKEKIFKADLSGKKLPNKIDLYKSAWCTPQISQGNTGTCWCYSTSSFFESEVKRIHNKDVKLSETFTVYCEYIEKARRFIQKRGDSHFTQGSQSNAVTRMLKMYGAMPLSVYTGLINGRKHHSHEAMYNEMMHYLNNLKVTGNWNETANLETIKAIMNHHLGTPPAEFVVEGKKYTPKTYLNDYLKLKMDDYVDMISYMQEPYYEKVSYKVPDNWWNSKEYYNVPLDVYMKVLKKAIQKGYTMSIGGDVSEAGFDKDSQCAIIPSFDIPSEYINEEARQFRFSNKSTTDDHLMHLVGYLENYNKDGKDWYLIKDSSSGSRNNDELAPEFGYYFFHEDYIKLKILMFTVHKDAVKKVLKKFK